MYDTMPMSEPRRDPTSPAHLISQYINVLAHAVITEPNEQSHKSSDHLLFLRKKVKIQTYGQTYLRMLMAMMVLNIWAVEDTMIRQKSPDDWQRCINDLKTLYKASIRKDASCFFVLDLAADESEYNFKTDGAEFHRLQQKLKDERVDPMVMKKLKHQFSKLTMRLKFIKALSIIRSDLERILGQEDVDVGEEDSEKSVFADASLNLVEQFTDYVSDGSFDDRLDVKETLLSLLECKKPSELKNRVKGNLFRDYWSIDILKQNLAAIMQTWEVVVLPLPEYTSMDHYTIPEARGVQFDENETEEVLVDDENVSEDDEEEEEEDDDDDDDDDEGFNDNDECEDEAVGEESEAEKVPVEEKEPEADDSKPQGEEQDDAYSEEMQFETQDRSDFQGDECGPGAGETEGLGETAIETQPPLADRWVQDKHSDIDEQNEKEETLDTQLDTQFETQPILFNQDEATSDTSSFATAQESEQDQVEKEGSLPNSDANNSAVAILEQKRIMLKRNAQDPLESMLMIASTANVASAKVPVAEDDIESVDSRKMSKAPEEKSTQRTKPGRMRKLSYSESEEEENTSGAGTPSMVKKKKSGTRLLFEDSEVDLMADSPPPPKRTRRKWTEKELNAVKQGYKRFFKDWSRIKSEYSVALGRRTNVNIKDCVRTLEAKGDL